MWLLAALLLAEPRSVVVPRVDQAPVLDGRLDEGAWSRAAVLDDFTGQKPVEGSPAEHPTRALVYRDDRNLYFAFDCRDPEPRKLRATFADRDAIPNDDGVWVLLDPFGDGRRGMLFAVNPYGVQLDAIHVEGTSSPDDDLTWDAVWFSAGKITSDGYVVEMALPFASLRFDPARDAWGANVARFDARSGIQDVWSPVRAAAGGLLLQLGRLDGMGGIPSGIAAQLIPELTTRSAAAPQPGEPLFRSRSRRQALDAGVTAKLSRKGTALDVTVNPDFSQIESDASRISVNQRFALFYDEKRPFFLEGRELLNTPWQVVYTRSIVDPLVGLKLAGKQGETSFAVLGAVDQSPAGSTIDPAWNPSAFRGQSATSLSARIASDLSDAFTIGAMVTDKNVGSAWNRAGGVDWNLLFASGAWRTTGQAVWSGTDEPDGGYLSGHAEKLRLMHFGRRFVTYNWFEQTTPGFRAENGFLERVGYHENGTHTQALFFTGASRGLVDVRPGIDATWLESTRDTDFTHDARPRVDFDLSNGDLGVSWYHDQERYRGTVYSKDQAGFEAASSPLKWLSFDIAGSVGTEIRYGVADPYLGHAVSLSATANLHPGARTSLAYTGSRVVFAKAPEREALRQAAGQGARGIDFDAAVSRLQARFFFTPDLSLRAIGDWDATAGKAGLSALLSWRPGPGSVAYLGWQDATATKSGVDVVRDRAVFLKFSYLFRY